MFHKRMFLALFLALGFTIPAQAGIFSRKPKVNPAEQVPTLIMQLKTDKDDGRRANAAEELRNHDPRAYPEMMTVLIDALTKDTSASVRSEAAATIARLRPINQQAGFALEQAAANDPAMRVRLAARQALWQYNFVGYRNGKSNETAHANNNGPTIVPEQATPTRQYVGKNRRTGQLETAEPPLADDQTVTTLKPTTPQLQPVDPPKLLTPPATKPQSKPGKAPPKAKEPEGPSLSPPQ